MPFDRSNYGGAAGESAVRSELAARGHNVATPAVDVGDDIITINPIDSRIQRVQVKAAIKEAMNPFWTLFQFRIKESAIQNQTDPDLIFVFALRAEKRWNFVIIRRGVLSHMINQGDIGTLHDGHYNISLSLRADRIRLRSGAGDNETDLTDYLDNWHPWEDNYWD